MKTSHSFVWAIAAVALMTTACGSVDMSQGFSSGPSGEEISCPPPVGVIMSEDCSQLLQSRPMPSLTGPQGSEAALEAQDFAKEINRDRARSCDAYNACRLTLSDFQTEQRILDDYTKRLSLLDPIIAEGKELRALAELRMLRDSYSVHPSLRKYLEEIEPEKPLKKPAVETAVAENVDGGVAGPEKSGKMAAAAVPEKKEKKVDLGPTLACRPHIVYFMEQLSRRFASTYYAVSPLTCARVHSGGNKTFEVDLKKGKCHKIIGASSEGTDLDIIVQGVVEDTKSDNYPMVEFCQQGTFTIKAVLTGGSGDLGIQVFSTDEIPPEQLASQ